jgi:hypothetical protein
MKTTKATCKNLGDGQYEYRGYSIFRTSSHSNAYNPWKISLGRSFATLAAAKSYIDAKVATEQN